MRSQRNMPLVRISVCAAAEAAAANSRLREHIGGSLGRVDGPPPLEVRKCCRVARETVRTADLIARARAVGGLGRKEACRHRTLRSTFTSSHEFPRLCAISIERRLHVRVHSEIVHKKPYHPFMSFF